ncbi:MAG: hypothetical protein ACREK5_03860 [Gemmatimonadota bacterium]
MGKPGERGRTTCTRCGSRVQTDRATSYFYQDGHPDEAYCRPCHREILGVRECGHDDDEGPCRACRADREAERQLARQERKAAVRREAA